ncbi:ABC transporter permease [Actinotignum urinale]|uniref:ABC transporter permease n=1 Tax=Actinotignum urinale TaxID=190146 RepID=UPI000C80D452|nr:ABC transporter permease [Actinotignum urinale]WIK58903.1 ABC transporter permease [Actinotignum urinale]
MIKNATAYVLRKKNRTVIVFIILTVVLSCLYACLNILKSGASLEKSLYKSSNSSSTIARKDRQGYFDKNELKGINDIKEIEEIITQYEGLARLSNTNAVDSGQQIIRDDIPSYLKNIVSIQATSNVKRNVLFNSGVFTIKEGRNIEKNDKNKILVHEEFVEKNKLKLRDKINLEFVNPNQNDKSNKQTEFEIVGIFSGKKQETQTGLSSDLTENMMFTDYDSAQKALNLEGNKLLVNKMPFFTSTPEKMDEAINKVKKINVDWEKTYTVDKGSNSFKEALESLSGVKHIIKIMTFAIMIGGSVVLSLILILWLRERIYEIGILLSIGVSKLKIIGQFIVELIFISIPALFVSLIFGNLVVNQIIGGLISSEDTTSITSNFISSGYNTNGLITFAQSYGALALIILLSVVFASGLILIKKPKEILSQIS